MNNDLFLSMLVYDFFLTFKPGNGSNSNTVSGIGGRSGSTGSIHFISESCILKIVSNLSKN